MKTEMDDKKEGEKLQMWEKRRIEFLRMQKTVRNQITFSKFLKQVRRNISTYLRENSVIKPSFGRRKRLMQPFLDYMPNKCGMLMTYHK